MRLKIWRSCCRLPGGVEGLRSWSCWWRLEVGGLAAVSWEAIEVEELDVTKFTSLQHEERHEHNHEYKHEHEHEHENEHEQEHEHYLVTWGGSSPWL